MEKNEILEILNDWNFWQKDLDAGIKRDLYLKQLKKLSSGNQILVITGARRSGKSFLMRQFIKELIKKKIARKQILMVNFEDPRFVNLDLSLLQKIYEVYLEDLVPSKKPYIFLDEIQEVKEWERWVRMMQELGKAKIVVSGSNARLLSSDLADLLTGRHLDIVVSPLSFKEFLEFNDFSAKNKLDLLAQKVKIKSLFREYLEFGGFPEVVLAEEKKETLLTYFEDILTKDLIRRYKIRKQEKLKSLAKFYFTNVSSLITFNSLEKTLGVSGDTIEKFSGYFSNVYLNSFVKRFSFKVKEQEKSPRKVYSIDTGLAKTVGFRFSQDLGKLAENLVFLELERKKRLVSSLEFFYWKDVYHQEVDFLIKDGLTIKKAIQVCWQLTNLKTRKREIVGLLRAMKELNLKEGLVITEDYEGEESIRGKR